MFALYYSVRWKLKQRSYFSNCVHATPHPLDRDPCHGRCLSPQAGCASEFLKICLTNSCICDFLSWDHMFTIAYANDIDWSAWSSGPRQHSIRGLPGGDVTKIIGSFRRMRGNDLRYILQHLKDVYFSLNFFLVIFLDTFCITMNVWF